MNFTEYEKRVESLNMSNGVCAVCGKPLNMYNAQFAHRIGNSLMNRKKYGSFFVDHKLNGFMTCSLECNSKCDISYKQDQVLAVLAEIVTYEIKNLYN